MTYGSPFHSLLQAGLMVGLAGSAAATLSLPSAPVLPGLQVVEFGPEREPLRVRGAEQVRIVDIGQERGVCMFDLAKELYTLLDVARHEQRSVEFSGWPLPGGQRIHFLLHSSDSFEPGAEARVVDAHGEHRQAIGITTFSGVSSDGLGHIFLGLSRSQAHGYIEHAGQRYFLSSGNPYATLAHSTSAPSGWTRVTLSHSSSVLHRVPITKFCGAGVGSETPTKGPGSGYSGASAMGLVGPPQSSVSTVVLRAADVFIEADDSFRALFLTDQDAIDYAALLVSAASELYRRDLGELLLIPSGYLRLWTVTPPWGSITTFSHLNNVQAWWTDPVQNPLWNTPRSCVHVFTEPDFGGAAWLADGGLCDNQQSYAFSGLRGSFPYPIVHKDFNNWDLFVVCHEFGHMHGSPHTSSYVPQIFCNDGSGPDFGTLMSTCHQTFGMQNVGMRLHPEVQAKMRTYTDSVGCLNTTAHDLGDWDLDGDQDTLDLAVFDAHLTQGFASKGSLECFDFDGDGMLSSCDREVLLELVQGLGERFCFGDVAVCPCGNPGSGCEGCSNSLGVGGLMAGMGSKSASMDDLQLTASQLPSSQNGLFFMAPQATLLPFGDGLRCVAGSIKRFSIQNSGPGGVLTLGPGIVSLSQGFGASGRISAGDTWCFQAWHRDPGGPCGSGWNLSGAYAITFAP